MNTKRSRGRPPGEGINDTPILMELAKIVLANPRTKVAPVVRRIVRSATGTRVPGASELATIRRVQVKWQRSKEQYLEQARAQRALVDIAMQPARPSTQRRGVRQPSALSRALDDLAGFGSVTRRAETAVGRAVRKAHERANDLIMGRESPTARAIRMAQEGGALKTARDMLDTPTMRAFRNVQSSVTIQRAMREILNSPTQSALREFQNSPTMRAMRLLNGKD